MNDAEMEKLLEQGLSGDPPRAEFREQVLRDSLLTLARVRRTRARWRAVSLSAAAVLIAGVSFLLGRYSLRAPAVEETPIVMPITAQAPGATVPSDLVAWLETAQLFRQLGMEDRMARAVDRASRLLPRDTATAGGATGPVVAVGGESGANRRNGMESNRGAHRPESVESTKRILAQVLGD